MKYLILNNDIIKYYNKKYYENYNRLNLGDLDPYIRFILSTYMQFSSHKCPPKVLDVGCGVGTLVTYLTQTGIDAYGVDFSLFAAKVPKQIRASATYLPFKDSCFDAITSIHLIEHLRHVEIGTFLQECQRVLKPHGMIFLITPNLLSILRPFQGSRWFADPTHVTLFTPFLLKKILEEYAFSNIVIRFKIPLLLQRGLKEPWVVRTKWFRPICKRFPYLQDILFYAITSTFLAYFREVIHLLAVVNKDK